MLIDFIDVENSRVGAEVLAICSAHLSIFLLSAHALLCLLTMSNGFYHIQKET